MGFGTNGLTFNVLRDANLLRHVEAEKFARCRAWSPAQWMMALVGEVGETANLLKKVDRGDYTINEIRAALADELADIQTYLDLLAAACGVNLGEATIRKWNAVSERVGSDIRVGADDWHRVHGRQEELP